MAFLTQLGDFDPGALGMLQRILLVSDGTLTDTLEAAMLEPILLSKVSINVAPAPAAVPSLELEPGSTIMDRKILLFGATTGRNYVYAESHLAVDRLPENFRRELMESDKPMGRLWSDYRLETWKELLFVAREPVARLAAYFPYATHDDLLSRHYRLISGGRPLMVINEYFPAAF